MSTDVEIERALASVAATLNDHQVDHFEPAQIQEIVTAALGKEPKLTVDGGGGLHDETGARIGAVRRTDSGEWIAERQNPAAWRSDTAIPSSPRPGRLRRLLTRLGVSAP